MSLCFGTRCSLGLFLRNQLRICVAHCDIRFCLREFPFGQIVAPEILTTRNQTLRLSELRFHRHRLSEIALLVQISCLQQPAVSITAVAETEPWWCVYKLGEIAAIGCQRVAEAIVEFL